MVSTSMSVGPIGDGAEVELEGVPAKPSAVLAGSGPRKLSSRSKSSSPALSVKVCCCESGAAVSSVVEASVRRRFQVVVPESSWLAANWNCARASGGSRKVGSSEFLPLGFSGVPVSLSSKVLLTCSVSGSRLIVRARSTSPVEVPTSTSLLSGHRPSQSPWDQAGSVFGSRFDTR